MLHLFEEEKTDEFKFCVCFLQQLTSRMLFTSLILLTGIMLSTSSIESKDPTSTSACMKKKTILEIMKCYDDQEEILQMMKIVENIIKQAVMKNKTMVNMMMIVTASS